MSSQRKLDKERKQWTYSRHDETESKTTPKYRTKYCAKKLGKTASKQIRTPQQKVSRNMKNEY